MSKNFSRADIRKIIIAEMKAAINKNLLVENTAYPYTVFEPTPFPNGTGPAVASEDRLRDLGRRLLNSDGQEIASAWAEIMRLYVGPFMTTVKISSQNNNFKLLDYIMGGWVPAPGDNKNDNLVRYGPWVPYGPHSRWPFRANSIIQEALATIGREPTPEEEELLDRLGVPEDDPRHRDSPGGIEITPEEEEELARLQQDDTGVDSESDSDESEDDLDPLQPSNTIAVDTGTNFSRHIVMPGVMMPWLSRRARREILWNSCLEAAGLSIEEAEEGYVVEPSLLRQIGQVIDITGVIVGDEREPVGNLPRCRAWGNELGWGGVLGGGFSDEGSLDLDIGGDGAQIGGSNELDWNFPLISNEEAREEVRVALPILVNKFLKDYGPWSTFNRYTRSDFEVADPQRGWGSSSNEPATAVSGWMKSESMFKNHAT